MIELVSLDVSNFCSKACNFCYNHSSTKGLVQWSVNDIVSMMKDCEKHGVKAISLGGGEPFEYDGIFNVISALAPRLFTSITTNGLPLQSDFQFNLLRKNKPHKIHITIHNPEDKEEIRQTLYLMRRIAKIGIKTGINLLISSYQLEPAKHIAAYLEALGLSRTQIIFVPRKYQFSPTPQQVAEVAGNKPFQSPSCLVACQKSPRFCSVSWDKKVNYCSYSPSKQPLEELSYKGIVNALEKITFIHHAAQFCALATLSNS